MPILSNSSTIFTQQSPVCLAGDQTQGYVFDPVTGCYVQSGTQSNICDDICDSDVVEEINCFTAVGDGNTLAWVIPWKVINDQSLVITVNGFKLHDADYHVTLNTTSTLVTLSATPVNGASIEMFGYQVADATRIKRFKAIGSGTTDSFVINWTANSAQSLIVSIDRVIQQNADFTLAYTSTGATNLTFVTTPANGASIEVIGFVGFAASSFKLFNDIGDNVTTDYIIPWESSVCGSLIITFDWIKQDTNSYTLTSINEVQTAISFDTPAGLGEDIEIVGITGFVQETPCDFSVEGDNLGIGGEGVYSSTGDVNGVTTLAFKQLKADPGLVIGSNADTITIGILGGGNSFENLGTGAQVLVEPPGATINYRTLIGGNQITLIQDTNDITIDFGGDATTLDGLDSLDFAQTITGAFGTGVDLVRDGDASGNSTLELYSLLPGVGITITLVGDDYVIAAIGGGGGLTEVADDPSPSLGGQLDVAGNQIISTSDGNIVIAPNGTGVIWLDGVTFPGLTGQAAGHVLTSDGVGGSTWVATAASTYFEDVVLRYTSGSGGDLSAIDAIVSETSGVTATIIDGPTSIVRFTFTSYKNPPTSIMSYGQDHASNQWNLRDASSYVSSTMIAIDGSGDPDNPDLLNPATDTPPVQMQLRQADTGSSANFGERAYLLVRFSLAE